MRMEYMYKTKVHSLEKQLKSSEAKLHDSDKHLKLLRRRDAASQAEASRAKHQIAELRCSHDTAIGQLQRAKQEVEEQLRDMHNELGAQLVQQRQRYDELEKNHAYRRDEVAALEERCAHLQERARRLTAFETAGELQKVQLENAQRRVVDLETELAELGEWREMSKTFQTRVARIPELEKEVERLRRENKNIYDTIGNKLLLEEEVHDLRSRLALSERTNADVVALQTSAQLLQAELNDYKAVAQDHCATGASGSATQLRARIEDILRNDVLLNSEKGAVRNEKNAAAEQVAVLQKQLEIYTKANDNLQTSLKFHKKTMHRVQKKLSLVANERDCYKQLIDNYEKDLTSKCGGGIQVDGDGFVLVFERVLFLAIRSFRRHFRDESRLAVARQTRHGREMPRRVQGVGQQSREGAARGEKPARYRRRQRGQRRALRALQGGHCATAPGERNAAAAQGRAGIDVGAE